MEQTQMCYNINTEAKYSALCALAPLSFQIKCTCISENDIIIKCTRLMPFRKLKTEKKRLQN